MVHSTRGPRFNKVRALDDEMDYSFPDREFFKFAGDQLPDDFKKFGIVHPTPENLASALKKSDRKEIFILEKRRKRFAWRALKHVYSHLFGRFRVLEDWEIKCVPDTSPGFPWSNHYTTKEEALRHHKDWFQYYLTPGAQRPSPIYTITPKSEYLSKEEIDSLKIRLFRNPPLDFLLLQIKYFGDMDSVLSSFSRQLFSAIGFMKEKGGWNNMVNDLLRFNNFFKYDISYFDKSFGPGGKNICYKLRRKMYQANQVIDEIDWDFLYVSETYSQEKNINGQIEQTACGAKSGNLTTSTDNTIMHTFQFIYHLAQFFSEQDTLNRFLETEICAYIYSDDIQASTDFPEFFTEDSLRQTFQQFGMDVKEYCMSQNPGDIHFLGARNIRFKNLWVPRYDDDRMLYAVANLSGRFTDDVLAGRILGLAKNLAFSPYCRLVCDYAYHLYDIGRWPQNIPLPSVYTSQKLFTSWEARLEAAGTKRKFSGARMQKPAKLKVNVPKKAPTHKKAGSPGGNQIQQKIVRKIEKTEEHRMALRTNTYLRNLVDPESSLGYRYPDQFSRESQTVQGIINHNMYYFPPTNAFGEKSGKFLYVISPTMMDPVLEYRAETIPTNSTWALLVQQQDPYQGLYPLVEDYPCKQFSSETLFLPGDATPMNVRNDSFWMDQREAIPQNRGLAQDGSVFYGTPINWQVITGGLVVRMITDSFYLTTASNIEVQMVSQEITGPWVPVPATVNSNVASATLSLATLGFGVITQYGLPGFGFRVRYNNAGSGFISLSSIKFFCVTTAQGEQPRFVPVNFPDQILFAKTVDQYRVNGMSAWAEYEGSTLNNGGQLAAIMYRGGHSPFGTGLWDYDLVGETPGGRQGALRLGNYSYWLPANYNDMLFRGLNEPTKWDHPYIVITGYVATTDQPYALRLRVVSNTEFISTSQTYVRGHTRPDIASLEMAAYILNSYPTSTENPDHMKTIRKILSEVGRYGKAAAQLYQDNKGWLVPAAVGLASVI